MIKLKSLLTESSVKIEVPKEPGTVPIPSNHLRLYHYTNADPAVVRREGLKLSHAKGNTYGEPNAIWASLKNPGNHKNYVEFSMAIDDPRFNRWLGAAPDVNAGVDFYKDRGSDFTIGADIKPSEFIAVHEPWHYHYRYMVEENMMEAVLRGEYDYIQSNHPDEYKAIQVIKHNFGT